MVLYVFWCYLIIIIIFSNDHSVLNMRQIAKNNHHFPYFDMTRLNDDPKSSQCTFSNTKIKYMCVLETLKTDYNGKLENQRYNGTI